VLVGSTALFYYLVRGFARSRRERALANAERVIALEKSLGIYVEPAVQSWTLTSAIRIHLANIVYFWGHLPLLAAFACWMFQTDSVRFRELRRVFLASQVIGGVIYFIFPVAPPRLMPAELGYVDTLAERHEVHYQLGTLKLFLNEYAAVPSLHFGWSLLITAGLRSMPGLPAKFAAVLSPVASLASIVATANHWVLDAVAGAAVMGISFRTVRLLSADSHARGLLSRRAP
jgi:PAP2 superfamily